MNIHIEVRIILLATCLLFVSNKSIAQDSIPTASITIDTLTEVSEVTEMVDPTTLLPKHYLPTQRILWGEKGLMRNFSLFKLSEQSRDLELDIRDKMFTAHRYIGFATLAGMVAQGIVGERLYNGHSNLKDLHEGLAGAVNIGYFTTAGMAFLAPPRLKDRPFGLNTLTIHQCLSIVHLSSMIATNVLSGMTEHNPNLKRLHRAAAYTAFGSFFAAMVVINF